MRTGPRFFEFLPPGINKGSALAELMARYAVPREQVLAIGDGENDISMFAVAGMSVAMAGAPPAVQARAIAQTAHCSDDGVALALRRYVLGA
jgi:hydroxymethylpyrimidine pyrophosphatase-like HAD family hydrolase